MGKITDQQRADFQEKINFYKTKIEDLNSQYKNLSIEMMKNKEKEPLLRIKAANLIMNQITIYCAMSDLSVFLLGVKNTAYLEKARQLLYEVIINLEKTVTNYVDVPFTDYSDKLEKISDYSDAEKLNIIKKIGYCIDLVKEEFGENTKWKWSFVEIEARFAVIAKNLFDMRKFQKLDDPREEGFQDRRAHLSVIQRLLRNASNGYREKFELSTKDIEDLKKAIDFQKALLRINMVLGDNEKIETCKKQIEVWNTLLEKHLAQIEEEKKKKISK
ncbi:MAG TPA: hypothetical protein PLE45_04330 [Spirochaetota bacterium]|nr:hypothetical protein [Spirochaetota bacterium]HOL56464.1 hypothetical protein [Spirochaetota bacterium]HPP03387.1 hypothetical protein [Spirochaetota bacterium]